MEATMLIFIGAAAIYLGLLWLVFSWSGPDPDGWA